MFVRCGLLLLCVLFSTSAADAQSVQLLPSPDASATTSTQEIEAKRVFLTGKQAFEDGRFADAVTAFRQAYALSGHSAMLFNIGLAADRLRDDALALHAFERYLREQPSSPDRAQVEQRVAALRAALQRKRAQAAESHEPNTATAVAVPSPVETANAFQLKDPNGATSVARDAGPDHDDGSVLERWWFWTALGVVAAGSVTAAILLTRDPGTESVLEPRNGLIVMTLERAR